MERKVHAWRIEEREIRRHEARRGRRHAYASLDATRTALIVVDMVPFFVDDNPYTFGIVPNISRLATAVRTAGGTVAWVLPGYTEPSPIRQEFYGAATAAMFARSGGDGPPRQRLWREFEPDDADLFVEKTAASAFFPGHSPLPALLERRGVDTVLITGTVTNVCCESSARDASTLGYRVVMVADGTSARRDEDHNATLYTIYRTFGDVRPTDEIIALLAA
ncbi:isochorismatase family cysteine hydrolase [Asanoa siamensis]|uniref:Hydrolase n=1 Tax=Asanoa siamensis TaxID=926357 RepID=A0ABQ4CXS8_9ACTN|nr:isochorismatase family cysteine hydrolase [Asanoa siamensis]GIF75803.1 hydrolase [Asanoa siamensis]